MKPEYLKKPKDRYFRTGLMSFAVLAAVVLLFFFLYKIDDVRSAFSNLIEVAQPIILGLVVAYLLNPLMKFLDKGLNPFFVKFLKFKKRGWKFARFISVIISIAVFYAAVSALLYLIVPEIITSATKIVNTMPAQIETAIANIQKFFSQNEILTTAMTAFLDWERNFLEEELVTFLASYASQLASGVIKTTSFIWDLIIGTIVAAYLLFRKETFCAQAKKILYAFVKKPIADNVMTISRKSNAICSGFINGKIIDSIIIGIICYIGLLILKMPYPVLISVIIGVTNIIPFFGPFIGAIPSIFLIALIDPWKGLYFTIFIIILQQFDGNILGPKILGDSTGLSPFWVIFSIVLCGGLFGIIGMVIGVPLFAIIYYIVNEATRVKLASKNLPVETSEYMGEGGCSAIPTLAERNVPVNKKKLLAKLGELVDQNNTLKRDFDNLSRENAELKALVQTLSENKMETPVVATHIEEPVKAAEEIFMKEDFAPTTYEPVLNATIRPKVSQAVLSDSIAEYGSVAIGKIVQESIKYSGAVSASNNKKELLNLIMGKGEIAKNEIYTIAQCDSSDEIKRELIDAQVNEALDYFKSVAGQI